VILGGGVDQFNARTTNNSGDTRNLVDELIAAGFAYTSNRTALNALPGGAATPDKLFGLFRTSHMNVAYDKLGFTSPRPTNQHRPLADSTISRSSKR
jgi:alkaline phosphatase